MALTITKIHDPSGSDSSAGVFDVTFDNSYPANGYVLTPSLFGRKAIHACIPIQRGTANRLITYDPTQGDPGTLRIWTAIGTEATTSSDQSTISCRVWLTGPTA